MFTDMFMCEVVDIASNIDSNTIEKIADTLALVRETHGRVFVLGVGGSAGNASHMVNDLRKLCGIETYCPTDNVSEITARTNDEGFETIFEEYLKVSRFSSNDCLFILSVGGGNKEKNVSVAIVKAIDLAIAEKAKIVGIVGRADGYAPKVSNKVVVVPVGHPDRVTPHSEAFQAVIWHSLVSNPKLQIKKTKW
jgi:D-sedoheptulose 7-phosphate isomerase